MSKREDSWDGPTEEAISKRAYELYLQRGSVPGYELDDWLTAKAELTASRSATSSSTEGELPTQRATTVEADSSASRRDGRERAPSRRTVRQSQSQ